MKQIVFYSWQSDLPNACNRGFIHDALEKATAAIAADDSIAVEPVVDRDTQGVPGSPDIASTIFAKITAADVFVADVSIIGTSQNRSTPNPNVLIELGYAFRALGHERVVLVFNKAFGQIEDLPFDLRMRRVLAYDMPANGTPRAPERKALEQQFDHAIRAALQHHAATQTPPPIPAVAAIESQQANKVIVLRRNLDEIFNKLSALEPKKPRDGGTVDELIKALDTTQVIVAEFTKIAEVIAAMNDDEAMSEMLRWFGKVFEKCDLPEGVGGQYKRSDHDYFRFLGHELFVTVIAVLLRERRWAALESAMAEAIPMKYVREFNGPGTTDWRYASHPVISLIDAGRSSQGASLQPEILRTRHTAGGLGAVMPFDEFMAADFFLFLVSEMGHNDWTEIVMEWQPWSVKYLDRVPMFLREAESKQVAAHFLRIFKIANVDEFRKRYIQRAPHVRKLFGTLPWPSPLRNEDMSRFGTR